MQKVKKIIIIEYGKNKYSAEKMQGAGIKMHILKRQSDVKDIKEVQNAGVRLCRCYIIGTPGFVDKVQKEIKKRNLGWKCITNYFDEDSVRLDIQDFLEYIPKDILAICYDNM